MNHEARWRVAGVVALLTAPLRLLGQGAGIGASARRGACEHGSPLPGHETRDEEIERRLHACETNLANVWERLNAS